MEKFVKRSATPYIEIAVVRKAHIGHIYWNQSYRSGIRKRSRGGTITITIIDRLNGSGYQALGDHAYPIGPYHENGSLDTSIPETYVRVAGRNSDGTYRDLQYSLPIRSAKRVNAFLVAVTLLC